MLLCKFCNKECKNDNSLRNHERLCKNNSNRQISSFENLSVIKHKNCQYCDKNITIGNIKRHEDSCFLNPLNLKKCVVCQNPIRNFKSSKGTCSHSCSNKHFKDLRNKPEKYKQYSTICWKNHKKECIVCGENKIVSVHHYNENHNDNSPENLIPLCPTHHQYIHSRYRNEIIDIVEKYKEKFTRL